MREAQICARVTRPLKLLRAVAVPAEPARSAQHGLRLPQERTAAWREQAAQERKRGHTQPGATALALACTWARVLRAPHRRVWSAARTHTGPGSHLCSRLVARACAGRTLRPTPRIAAGTKADTGPSAQHAQQLSSLFLCMMMMHRAATQCLRLRVRRWSRRDHGDLDVATRVRGGAAAHSRHALTHSAAVRGSDAAGRRHRRPVDMWRACPTRVQ